MEMTGTRVWCRHKDDIWRQAIVRKDFGDKVKVDIVPDPSLDTTDEGISATHVKKDLAVFDDSHIDDAIIDLSRLNNFEEAPLLGLVRRRFFQLKVYTYVGEVMIAVNPYNYYEHLVQMPAPLTHYTLAHEPHVRAIASFAFRNIQALKKSVSATDIDKVNQGIIVSGESGSGKTEACKNVMKYLVALTLEHQKNEGILIDMFS